MIFELTFSTLSTAFPDVPISAGVYIAPTGEDLPDLYVTFSLIVSTPEQDADDVETLRDHTVQISIFSRNGLTALPDVSAAMVAAGFRKGDERMLVYDRQTRHFGLAIDFYYLEEVTNA